MLYGKNMKYILLTCFTIFSGVLAISQVNNTVGVLTFNNPTEGYNLIYPHNQPNVYLINNCGEIVHTWEDETKFSPGNISYLTEDGLLVRAKKPATFEQETFGAGGGGGIIEWLTWDNEFVHSFSFMDSQYRVHHDLSILPNGNVLAIVWERRSLEEVIENGGNQIYHPVEERWPDMIIELDPSLDSIVWEWHSWDHLIQDFDSSKLNFGIVEDHPELININTDLKEFGLRPDWMHFNAIDYNADRDQIVISVPHFNELWVIDHSTTTAEAATHSGGNSGRGGDLLYRWGNSASYNQGVEAEQKAFFLHDTRWELDNEGRSTGRISFFNNRVGPDSSQVNIISPVWDGDSYLMESSVWLPMESDRIITHPNMPIFSSGLSGGQILPNGNVLVSVGREGFAFEITPEDYIEWEYKVPLLNGEKVEQGTILEVNDNTTFRVNRYPTDCKAFIGRDLTPNGTIEVNPNLSLCTTTANNDVTQSESSFILFPNPTSNYLSIEGLSIGKSKVVIYDIAGREVFTKNVGQNERLDISEFADGVYWLKIGNSLEKIIKQSF